MRVTCPALVAQVQPDNSNKEAYLPTYPPTYPPPYLPPSLTPSLPHSLPQLHFYTHLQQTTPDPTTGKPSLIVHVNNMDGGELIGHPTAPISLPSPFLLRTEDRLLHSRPNVTVWSAPEQPSPARVQPGDTCAAAQVCIWPNKSQQRQNRGIPLLMQPYCDVHVQLNTRSRFE